MRFRHAICTVLGIYSLKYVRLLGGFFKIIFGCRPFLKFLLNLLQYCFCFLFWIFGHERLLLNHAKTPGFLAPGGEEFNPGPKTSLDHSELLCNKVLLKYKGDRESF